MLFGIRKSVVDFVRIRRWNVDFPSAAGFMNQHADAIDAVGRDLCRALNLQRAVPQMDRMMLAQPVLQSLRSFFLILLYSS